MKTGQFLLPHWKKRKKKKIKKKPKHPPNQKNINRAPLKTCEYHQTYQQTHHGSSLSGEENEVERIFEEIMANNFQKN